MIACLIPVGGVDLGQWVGLAQHRAGSGAGGGGVGVEQSAEGRTDEQIVVTPGDDAVVSGGVADAPECGALLDSTHSLRDESPTHRVVCFCAAVLYDGPPAAAMAALVASGIAAHRRRSVL